jgi:hypothetical protein
MRDAHFAVVPSSAATVPDLPAHSAIIFKRKQKENDLQLESLGTLLKIRICY